MVTIYDLLFSTKLAPTSQVKRKGKNSGFIRVPARRKPLIAIRVQPLQDTFFKLYSYGWCHPRHKKSTRSAVHMTEQDEQPLALLLRT